MTEIILPPLGEGVTQATVVEWLKAPGETFAKGETVLEIMTDKVGLEVEAEANGRLTEILVSADQEVRIGTVLGRYEPT